ncbi:hypothetical protein [Allosalinactinospora lopnorensis]|uniref:hypothetical protein n=1 Tax=Allosalinactinospora lopnorensis TaxID=1352348 RepID=UPI000623DD56|nr:hypothetical protein [Allosalinactinospora lopnorensis]
MYSPGQPYPQQPGHQGPVPGPYSGQGGYGRPPMPYGGYQQPYAPIHPTVYGGVELASWGRRAGGYLYSGECFGL